MSFATLEYYEGRDWHRDSLLSLAGVYQTKRTDVVPIALEQYLNDHPNIQILRLHLDNDEVGRGAVAGIVSGLNGRYQVYDEPPKCGKDVNDQLKKERWNNKKGGLLSMMDIRIYQVNLERDKDNVGFMGYDTLPRFQGAPEPNPEIYDKVFEGSVDCANLESVYAKFNTDHPRRILWEISLGIRCCGGYGRAGD